MKRAWARCRWLIPVILATWEDEIGRIGVQGQLRIPHLQNKPQQNGLEIWLKQ
jgi:hypothetical protein